MLTEDMPDDVRQELEDERFTSRSHYSRATYALGCHGPMCRKRERDRGRIRNEQLATDEGREYKPNPDMRIADDETLDQIIRWHRPDLFTKVTA